MLLITAAALACGAYGQRQAALATETSTGTSQWMV
jgi:hypothetical protein